MTRSFWLILAAVVWIAWSSASAAPPDPDVPLPYARNDWRMISKDAKTTTSKCIGNPKTPVCAVETIEACLIRRDERLCLIGAGPLKIYLPKDHVIPPAEKYRITRARRVIKLPSWETPENGYGFRHLGDIEVEIDTWYPDESGAWTDHSGMLLGTFLVRQTGDRWSIAGRISCDIVASGSACVEWPYTLRQSRAPK